MEFMILNKKDLGLQRVVMDALPYAVVGGAFEGSFTFTSDLFTALSHIVPHGQQLKILFLRVWTQAADGAKFSIVQTNPIATGTTGAVEAYPVVGNVPEGVRDYPMVEAAGCETLQGRLEKPIHVLEGSVIFNILHIVGPLTGARYGLVWWGVQKVPEPPATNTTVG
jgi:hypothetical protein